MCIYIELNKQYNNKKYVDDGIDTGITKVGNELIKRTTVALGFCSYAGTVFSNTARLKHTLVALAQNILTC